MSARTPSGVNAILFDKDGTLFSFDATWRSYCERMFDRLAVRNETLKQSLADACGFDRRTGLFQPGSVIVAGRAEDVLHIWSLVLGGEEQFARVNDAHEDAMADLPLELVAGGREALLRLRAHGLVLGVATNDTEYSAKDQLANAGLSDLFSFVAGSDSGFGGKPGAGMAKRFCQTCNVTPQEMAMVGDSVHDMEFARNAGIAHRLAVLSGPAEKTDLSGSATAVLPDISHLPSFFGLAEAAATAPLNSPT